MAVSAREQRILILAGLVGAVFVVTQIVPAVQGPCGCLFKEESPDSSEHQSRITSGGGKTLGKVQQKIYRQILFGKGEKVR
jgi:hypothetical protein